MYLPQRTQPQRMRPWLRGPKTEIEKQTALRITTKPEAKIWRKRLPKLSLSAMIQKTVYCEGDVDSQSVSRSLAGVGHSNVIQKLC